MKTLIELYDERAVENVLGPEIFKPDTVIYLCPPEIWPDKKRRKKLIQYFRVRGVSAEIHFENCSIYRSEKILEQLRKIWEEYPDIALDVTGGTDAALFAAGMFAADKNVPAFTYSRKKNSFYDILGAEFADELVCRINYNVRDIFLMAGGLLKQGRVDNNILNKYMGSIDGLFDIFMKYRKRWIGFITYVQRISRADEKGNYTLKAEGSYFQKGDHGGRVKAEPEILKALEKLGYIKDLNIIPNEYISFEFKDEQIRAWLRDVGSVLELYVYKACIKSGIFNDVVSSAVVEWEESRERDSVKNEIDVVATRGIIPIFISCKATDIRTEALNELAILRDRFGGKAAKAVIVTTEICGSPARHRAAQLGIAVIDREELKPDILAERLKVILKVREHL